MIYKCAEHLVNKIPWFYESKVLVIEAGAQRGCGEVWGSVDLKRGLTHKGNCRGYPERFLSS